MKSEMKMPRDRDREVKFLENSREILQNLRKFLDFDPNTFHFANFFSGMLKRAKLVRKVEYQMYELLLIALQYQA